jgi:hypothetical protein
MNIMNKMYKPLIVILLFVTLITSCATLSGRKESEQELLLLSIEFEDRSEFSTGGGFCQYWDIAPLEGPLRIPSQFEEGGSQRGKIFFGSFGKGFENDDSPCLIIDLPDMSDYSEVFFTVSLGATDGTKGACFEIYHRDSLIISSTDRIIDRFLPVSDESSLWSETQSAELHYKFADFTYGIDNRETSITFTFASTDFDEVIGIDSFRLYGRK